MIPDDAPPPTTSQGRYVPPPFVWQPVTPEQDALIRRRQRGRAIVLALLLGALVVLIFAITLVKIKQGAAS